MGGAAGWRRAGWRGPGLGPSKMTPRAALPAVVGVGCGVCKSGSCRARGRGRRQHAAQDVIRALLSRFCLKMAIGSNSTWLRWKSGEPKPRFSPPPWSRLKGKYQVSIPTMPPLRCGICMGVDSRNHPFALGLPPARLWAVPGQASPDVPERFKPTLRRGPDPGCD